MNRGEAADVVHVLPHGRSLGGSERMVLDLIESPRLQGVRQRVAFARPGEVASFPESAVLDCGVAARALGPVAVALAIARMRPLVVHGWLLQGNLVGSLARNFSPSSYLVTSERNVGHNMTPLKRALERIVARSEHVVTVNSSAVRDAALQRLPRRAQRLRIIPPGIRAPRRPGETVSCTAVMVGRLHRVKDHATALRAWASVRANRPHATLAVVGDGPERPRLEALAASLGLGTSVVWSGERDPAPFLYGAELFLCSSSAEGFSRALLEALCAGVPCVSTRVGGIEELPFGMLRTVPPGDYVALSRAIEETLVDGNASRRARELALFVRDRFSWERCHDAYRELYKEFGVA